jgi:hypothetical protein
MSLPSLMMFPLDSHSREGAVVIRECEARTSRWQEDGAHEEKAIA